MSKKKKKKKMMKRLQMTTLWRLMIDFKLKPHKKPKHKKLYEHFHKELGIKMASDLLNFETTQITQPSKFKSTKMRMHLVKMGQFITKKATFCGWKGTKTASWIELESNRVSIVFGTKNQSVINNKLICHRLQNSHLFVM